MKNTLFLFIVFLGITTAFAGESKGQRIGRDSIPATPRTFYLGLGTGINNSAGFLGIQAEKGIANTASVFGAAGLSTWGSKLTVGGRYYFHFPRRAALGVSYSYCTGAKDAKISLEVVDPTSMKTTTKDVPMDLDPATSLNFTFLYFWKMGKHHRFNIEAGYAIPLQGYAFTVKSNDVLTNQSKNVLHLLQPGGIVLAATFTFGIF